MTLTQATVVDGESDRPFVLGIDKQGRLGVNRGDDQRNGWWVVVNKDKTLGVVVRDDKGYVRYAAQRPDGSFGGWSLVWSGKAATDPSTVQLGDGRWGVFFLDTEGVERMYWLSAANGSTALAAPGARTKRSVEPESQFTGGPTAKQGTGRPTANTAAK